MKFAVFGAGRMGEHHIANIAAHSQAEIAYIIDVANERANLLADRFGGRAAADPLIALKDPSVEAVIISSPTDSHVDLIIASAKAGKAILCEKPIDLSMSRVEMCERAIKDCNVPIMIGFQRRFDATHRAVKESIDNGDIGEVEVITIVSRDPNLRQPIIFALLEVSSMIR